jgi:hypothetical protein
MEKIKQKMKPEEDHLLEAITKLIEEEKRKKEMEKISMVQLMTNIKA